MTTADTVLLIILACLLSLFFILCIAAIIIVIKLLNSVRRVAAKAESVIDSVETAAETFKGVSGRMTVLKILKNVIDLGHRGRKG